MTVYRTRPEALAESGSLHPVYLAQLCQVARDEGLAPERLLGDSGLDERSLHRPVPVQALHRVLARLQEWVQARQPGRNLALDLGLDTPVTAHGPLTLLLNSAPTLRQGLQALADHLQARPHSNRNGACGPSTTAGLRRIRVAGPSTASSRHKISVRRGR